MVEYLFGFEWFDAYNSSRARCAWRCDGWWFIYDAK